MMSQEQAHDSNHTSHSMLLSMRVAPQDQAAWTKFLARYQPLIFGWCAKWGLQKSDIEDVAQDVMLRLSKSMQTFDYDPSGSFRSWLRMVTFRAWADWAKQNQKPGRGNGDSTTLDLLHSVEARDDLSQRLEEEYDAEMMELAILRVRMRVQPRTWQAFQLTAIDGVAASDVANQLNMQIAHVYVARSDVKKVLQAEVKKLELLR